MKRLDNEKSNKISLLLTFVLVLLVFMDFQARRHFQKQVGFGMDPIGHARDRILEAQESLVDPIRTTADSLLGTTRDVIVEKARHVGSVVADQGLHKVKELEIIKGLQAQKIDNPGTGLADKIESHVEFVSLYYIRFRRGRSQIVRVKRGPSENFFTYSGVIEALQKGPTLREHGLINAFTEKISIYSVIKEKNKIVLDVSSDVAKMGNHVIRDRLDQMIFTMTQFPGIDFVVLRVDGKEVHSLGQGRFSIPRHLYPGKRKVFSAF